MLDFKQKISKEVWTETYKWETENIWQDTAIRISKDNSRAEEKDQAQFWADQFLSIVAPMRYIPGGRIISNAGLKLKGTTYINCFPEYMQVLTNRGYLPISEIEIGDYVLTHKKRWRKVVNTLSRKYEGEVDIYKTSHIRGDIVVTKEHPFYQGNNEWEKSETNSKLVMIKEKESFIQELQIIDITTIVKNCHFDQDYAWYETNFIGGNGAKGKKVGPKIRRFIEVNKDLAYALGRFAGDGSTWNQYKTTNFPKTGFNIVFNQNEQEDLTKVKKIIDKTFGIETNINISSNGNENWHYIRASNPIVASFLSECGGENSYTKKVPYFIWSANIDIKYSFLLGLLDADGCITQGSNVNLVLNNEKLLNDALSIANICGIHFKKRNYFSTVDKYSAQKISISGVSSHQLRQDMSKKYNDNRVERTFRENGLNTITQLSEDEYLINKFEKYSEDFNGYVYNISVDEDESYIVNDIVVHNCYVGGFSGKNQDSIEGIYRALANQAKTLKSEGGYGFCIDVIRPRGFYIEGIANYSPGPVEIAKLWNTSSAVITSGANIKIENKKGKKKIRKGAQMITMSCWHPSIEEFITAKQTPGVLDKFNMSVLITDDFIEAVKKNKKWDLIFPDTRFEKYDDEWNGNIIEWQAKDYPVVIVKTFENANILWDLIMSSTYNRNEPGVIFIDRVNELNNLFYSEYIDATNPCGEQPLSKDSSCNLGSLNLVKYINADKTGWDYDLLRKDIPIAVRFQDNINDLTNFPLKEQKELAQKNRRIGIGYMGYGSALYLLQIPYGSKKALKITEELCKFVTNEIYRASTMIAKEKGKFPGFTEQYLESKFIKLLDKDVQELIAKHGTRCSHHTMIAPTGNTGILAENVSGGLEPVVSPEYTRTIIVNSPIDGLIVPMDIDWDTQKFTNTENEWAWTKEGDEHILRTKFNETVYKIDRNRGLTREERVMDYAVLELGDKFNPEADYVKTIFNLGVQEHVDTMAIFAKWIDAGISKCLEKGTLIPTSEGLIKIEDFTTNEKPDSFIKISKNIKTNSQKILSHYYAGIKQATRITLDNGAEISGASDTHKVKTAEGWKVLSEIKKGDIILGQLLESHGRGNLPILWDSKYKSNANRITIPNKMSVEFAEWIGMICADGHSVLSAGNVGLTCKNTKVENRFIELTKIIFKKEPVKSIDKRNQVVVLYLTSRNLVRFIENFIGKGAYNKYIPSQILQGNKEEKKAFLSGISLDGYYKPKFGLYIYEGMSKELAYQTSELCRSFGLPKVYIGKKRNDFGTVYGVMVSNLLQKEITCIEEHKNKQVVYQSYNVFIGNLSDTTKIKANHPSYSAIRSMWQRKKTLCKIETATKFGWNTSILAYKVTRVEEDGLKEMYDIELDGNHEYIVNGMISHNTINLPNDYSYESFKNIYMDAYDTKFIKGFTTYRIGTMTSVLSVDTKQEDKEEEFRTTTATKRPKSLDADIFKVTVSGEKWIVFVSRIKDRPYELFAGKISLVDIPSSIKDGKIVKTGKGHYEFEHAGEVIISDITKVFHNDVNDSITRLVSTSLRHGAEVKFIVEQLNKAKGVVTDFSKCLARALKHYIKDGETQNEKCPSCGKQTLIFQQGCTTCTDCGYSRCG